MAYRQDETQADVDLPVAVSGVRDGDAVSGQVRVRLGSPSETHRGMAGTID
jgi:hypothetical protein